MKLAPDTAETPRPYARKTRFVTVNHLDRRTVAARRAKALAKEFEAQLGGGELSPGMRLAVDRAAALAACAEDARVRRLAGDPSVNLDDLVRLDRLADLAIRRLGIGAEAKPHQRRRHGPHDDRIDIASLGAG